MIKDIIEDAQFQDDEQKFEETKYVELSDFYARFVSAAQHGKGPHSKSSQHSTLIHNYTLPRLQNDLMLFLDGTRYEIHTQKFEFGPEDFLAYIGGYLVSKWMS